MRKRAGFSLIELLVAIAIIGILSAILFPVFISARERAKRSYCVNNMRQIFLALQMYADDNSGFVPPAPKACGPNGDMDFTVQKYGFALLKDYCKNNRNIFRCPNAGSRQGSALNPAAKKAEALNEAPYDLILPDNTMWQCSYHFWPDLYGYRAAGKQNEWTSGRLDCNLRDKDLRLANVGLGPSAYNNAVALGGPLVENFLHYYGGKDKSQHGVLCLTVKGCVKFLPAGKYPW